MEEDIKIVEEFMNAVNKYGFDYDIDEEKHTSINYKEFKAIENLLSRLKTAERMNDVLVKKILISDIAHSICKEVKIEECEKHELYSCKQCIKEWARKKVEDGNK